MHRQDGKTALITGSTEGRSGLYFNGLREARANAQAYDAAARQRLRTISMELTGLAEKPRRGG
jgi:hypothetical protein